MSLDHCDSSRKRAQGLTRRLCAVAQVKKGNRPWQSLEDAPMSPTAEVSHSRRDLIPKLKLHKYVIFSWFVRMAPLRSRFALDAGRESERYRSSAHGHRDSKMPLHNVDDQVMRCRLHTRSHLAVGTRAGRGQSDGWERTHRHALRCRTW